MLITGSTLKTGRNGSDNVHLRDFLRFRTQSLTRIRFDGIPLRDNMPDDAGICVRNAGKRPEGHIVRLYYSPAVLPTLSSLILPLHPFHHAASHCALGA